MILHIEPVGLVPSAHMEFLINHHFGAFHYFYKNNCFLPYEQSGELSHMDSGVKSSFWQCRLADGTKEYCASGFCTMERRL